MRTRALAGMQSIVLLGVCAVLVSCGGDNVRSDQQARLAYLGLDKSVGKSLKLGFDGFNAATSANIPAQSTTGDLSGTLVITGQVDQGASTNKGMRLLVGMVDYSDGKVTDTVTTRQAAISYTTNADTTLQPALTLALRNIPNGTFTGTLVGDFQMTGEVTGIVTLSLNMAGEIEDDGTGKVRRKAGTTTVSGTATAGGNVYGVSVTL
jgi:hypothetical protein